MLGRVHPACYAQNLLRGRDGNVINPSGPENVEPGAESGPRKKGQPGAARAAVQIQAERGPKIPDRTRPRRQNPAHIGMVLKHGRETVFHHDGNFQIGPGLF